MEIFVKRGILHTLMFHLHTLSCYFWLNLWTLFTFILFMSSYNPNLVWMHGAVIMVTYKIDGLVHGRCNSSALAMELSLSCTNPLKIWSIRQPFDTCINSNWAVVTCANLWLDWIIRILITVNRICLGFQLCVHKPFAIWVPVYRSGHGEHHDPGMEISIIKIRWSRWSDLYNRNSYTGKTSLYWDVLQKV